MTRTFHPLRLLWVVLIGLLVATMGKATAAAARGDLSRSTPAAKNTSAYVKLYSMNYPVICFVFGDELPGDSFWCSKEATLFSEKGGLCD